MADQGDPGDRSKAQKRLTQGNPCDDPDRQDPEAKPVDRGCDEPAKIWQYAFLNRAEDEQPAHRIRDQADQDEVHEVALRCAIGQTELTQKTARKTIG